MIYTRHNHIQTSSPDQNHRPVIHVLKLTYTCVPRFLSPDGHPNYFQETLLVLSQVKLPSVWSRSRRESPFSSVHFDLLDALPRLFVNGLSIIQLIPKNVTQAYFGISKEADLQIPIGRDAQSVAGAAEMIRHACDKPDAALEAWNSESLTGIIGVILRSLDPGVSLSYCC